MAYVFNNVNKINRLADFFIHERLMKITEK
jgi:hypothetical protein